MLPNFSCLWERQKNQHFMLDVVININRGPNKGCRNRSFLKTNPQTSNMTTVEVICAKHHRFQLDMQMIHTMIELDGFLLAYFNSLLPISSSQKFCNEVNIYAQSKGVNGCWMWDLFSLSQVYACIWAVKWVLNRKTYQQPSCLFFDSNVYVQGPILS